MPIVIGIVALVILILVLANVVIVPQEHAYVIEFLGTYKTTWHAGLHVKIPFLERIVKKVSLKEQVLDFPPQNVITKDNVSMKIDTVIYMKIVEPRLFAYGVEAPLMAIENLTATALRNIIGNLELDTTLTSRDTINSEMQQSIDEATDPWGIKVNRVEVKNILPPAGIQEAMEKQMKAERERREQVLVAEGKKKAAILEAEGEKESALLRAEADKQKKILAAQAEKESIVLVATAERERREQEAAGYEAIKAVLGADAVVRLKAIEGMVDVSGGTATKIIIPSEMQGLMGTLAGAKEALTDAPKGPKDGAR